MISGTSFYLYKITRFFLLFLLAFSWQVGYSQTEAIKNKVSAIKNSIPSPSFKELLSQHKFSVSNEGVTDRNYFGNGYYYMNNLLVTGGISVAKLPFLVQFLRQDYFSDRRSSTNTWKAQFDKDAFLDNYRKKLKENLKIDDLVPKDQVLEKSKETASARMKASVDSMNQEYSSKFGKSMPGGMDTITDFTNPDAGKGLQNQLTAKYTQLIKEKEEKLKQLQEKQGTPDPKEVEQSDKLKKEIAAYYKLVEYYKRYQELSKKLDLKGLNKQSVKEQTERAAKYEKLLNDPESLKALAEQHLPLSGTEKLFMNVQKLNMGQQTVTLSDLSLYNYLNKGISMEVLKENRYFFLLAGKEQDLNAVYDRAEITSLSQNDHVAVGMRMGKGGLSENHMHVSLFSFKQKKQLSVDSITGLPHKSAVVAGISNRFDIDESSSVEIELSRSAVEYENAQGYDSTGRKSALSRLLGKEGLGQSLALIAKYKGDFSEVGLNVNAAVSSIAAGYYNPGNPFLARGAKQGELGVKKAFWKKKLVVNVKGNYRLYEYGGLTESKWRNTSIMTDVRIKLKGGQQTGFKYQAIRGIHINDSSHVVNNGSDIVSADLSLQQRLGNVFYRNMLSVTYNASRYLLQANEYTSIKTLTGNSLQSIMVGTHLIYLNTTYAYAHNPSSMVFFNSTYNVEGGFTYQLNEKWSASSATGYSGVVGWYKQAGVKQTITGAITPKLDFNFYIDKKVNLSKQSVYYDDLLRIDGSLKYSF
jgi:hypothetical protein